MGAETETRITGQSTTGAAAKCCDSVVSPESGTVTVTPFGQTLHRSDGGTTNTCCVPAGKPSEK